MPTASQKWLNWSDSWLTCFNIQCLQINKRAALLLFPLRAFPVAASVWAHSFKTVVRELSLFTSGRFWVTGEWFILWISILKLCHHRVGLLSNLESRTLSSCQQARWQVTSTQLADGGGGGGKTTCLWTTRIVLMFGSAIKRAGLFHCWLKQKCINKALTWRWKVEKWMSGMNSTGWVSRSPKVLKMVTSFLFWRRVTLTSGTERKMKVVLY